MDSEFLSGSYRSLLAVDLGRDVGTVLLCLGHYVAAVRGERNSLVHLFLSLENGISGDFFKKCSMSIQKGSHHCPFWDFVLEALLSVALLTFADRHRVFLRLVLDLLQIEKIILRALARRFFRRCPCTLPFTLSNWKIKTSHPALWDCVCDPIALHLPLGGRLDRPRPWDGHLHTTGYMHQTLLRSECFNSFVLLA